MKTIVIYKSKTGFTKKYADWISEELSADIYEISNVTIDKLTDYETIICGGGLYAGGINGVKLITKNIDKLKDKNIIVFATGASPEREEVISEVRNRNFTPKQQESIKFFYLRGGFDYKKLKFIDKMLMILLKFILKSKKNLTPDERGMLEAYNTPVDFTRKENIEEIISYVNDKS